MKRLIQTLDRILTPILILTYVTLCVVLLAITDQESGAPLLLSMLWAGIMMTAMRWGIWGILKLAHRNGKESPRTIKALVRTVEILQLILTAGAVYLAVLLRSIPAVWLLIPTVLFGLRGAIRFDAEHL